ncbi:alpha-D-ribose 1-methylphosphonate 5-triphosphate diphosphatase [Zavarzinia compransoris]|uniref:Phosphonate metabolism protein PhnM n=1 Tax=Zavarzinia compransoris TaxID=1264899 RepID=A0A317E8B0_9PROT|nr:alpha-D-ribose 1-methylphosphonate 5-triphosphate diphosphatase [Zavarzinia compransoris]PWR23327.1 phosphonate metabolism protein PhnM [Zavarzinia compransoris]TDP46101.1 alpha-D-ribose 1-methylphosphonate 5-triphosphate diphosphatase [Zavarzinia compransoris]
MSTETILTNATVVTPTAVLAGATLVVRDGRIAAVESGRSHAPGAVDLGGDHLLPGLVDLHTDNLEKHMMPRVRVPWPAAAAIIAHDRQVLAAGITTVLDSLAVGDVWPDGDRVKTFGQAVEAWKAGRDGGVFKARHALHLRCEIGHENVVDLFSSLMDDPDLLLASVMDHTPGQRQFVDAGKYRQQYPQLSDAEFDAYVERRRAVRDALGPRHRGAIIALCKARGVPVASHDDRTPEEVAEALADGITISEFPTSLEAARAAHGQGMSVIGGAPNLVRGGSHSGNVAVAEMAAAGVLDVMASDYVPASMLIAAFALHDDLGHGLPQAIATVSANPARALGLDDIGALEAGRRADVLRVKRHGRLPVVDMVWRDGRRVM